MQYMRRSHHMPLAASHLIRTQSISSLFPVTGTPGRGGTRAASVWLASHWKLPRSGSEGGEMSILSQSFAPSARTPAPPFAANSTSSPGVSRGLPLRGAPSSVRSPQPPRTLLLKEPVRPEPLPDVEGLDLFSSASPSPSPTATVAVFVSSAVELERKQIDKIARKMRRMTGAGELRMENVVDPTLIAGFVIRYEDDEGTPESIDLSVKGHLAELADRIETSDKRTDEQERGWGLAR